MNSPTYITNIIGRYSLLKIKLAQLINLAAFRLLTVTLANHIPMSYKPRHIHVNVDSRLTNQSVPGKICWQARMGGGMSVSFAADTVWLASLYIHFNLVLLWSKPVAFRKTQRIAINIRVQMTLTDFKLFLVAATYHVLVQKRWVSIFCYIDQSKFTLHMWFISDLKELLI